MWKQKCAALPRAVVALAVGLAAVPASAGPLYAVRVDGLACPFCAYGIEKHLLRIEGVAAVRTNIERGEVVIEAAEGRALDRATVERAVRRAGFKLRGFEPRGRR